MVNGKRQRQKGEKEKGDRERGMRGGEEIELV